MIRLPKQAQTLSPNPPRDVPSMSMVSHRLHTASRPTPSELVATSGDFRDLLNLIHQRDMQMRGHESGDSESSDSLG